MYRRDDKGNYLKDKKGRYIPVYEPYKIKVFNTIDFAKSMHYNPFAYISKKNREKDILKFLGESGETALYCVYCPYLCYVPRR